MKSLWTNKEKETLKLLWEAGVTAKKIAAELGEGRTRNAVIGQVHRMGLSERPSPIKRQAVENIPAVEEAPMNDSHDISALFVPLMPPTRTRHKGRGVALVDLKSRDCRFPLGDPQDEDFGFCGARTAVDKIYCSHHIGVCYVSDSQYRKGRKGRAHVD